MWLVRKKMRMRMVMATVATRLVVRKLSPLLPLFPDTQGLFSFHFNSLVPWILQGCSQTLEEKSSSSHHRDLRDFAVLLLTEFL